MAGEQVLEDVVAAVEVPVLGTQPDRAGGLDVGLHVVDEEHLVGGGADALQGDLEVVGLGLLGTHLPGVAGDVEEPVEPEHGAHVLAALAVLVGAEVDAEAGPAEPVDEGEGRLGGGDVGPERLVERVRVDVGVRRDEAAHGLEEVTLAAQRAALGGPQGATELLGPIARPPAQQRERVAHAVLHDAVGVEQDVPDGHRSGAQSVPCSAMNARICSDSSGRHTIRSGR